MKLSKIIPLLIVVALLSYFVGQCNVPWRYNPERLERNPIADLPHKELKRVTSPDGIVDAILARVETDSLSADGFAVYLAPAGKELDLQSLDFDRKYFTQTVLMTLNLCGVNRSFLKLDIRAVTSLILVIIGGFGQNIRLKYESFQKTSLFLYQNKRVSNNGAIE